MKSKRPVNKSFNITATGKIENPKKAHILSSGEFVNVDFSAWNIETLVLNQGTTLQIMGEFKTGDCVELIVSGNYPLRFEQSGFTFKGLLNKGTELVTYNGIHENYLRVICVNADNRVFVLVNELLGYVFL